MEPGKAESEIPLPSDRDFLRGALFPQFASWDEQDACIKKTMTQHLRQKMKAGDVLAVPAFLCGVRQNGYYVARLQKSNTLYFYVPTPKSAARFVLGKEHLVVSRAENFFRLKHVSIFPDGTMVLKKTVAWQMKKVLQKYEAADLDLDLDLDPDLPVAAIYHEEWLKHVSGQSCNVFADIDKDLDVARKGLGAAAPKRKRKIISIDEDLDADTDTRSIQQAPLAFVLKLPADFESWEELDEHVCTTNADFFNISHESGFSGTFFAAIPIPVVDRSLSRRTYMPVKINSYDFETNVLHATMLLSTAEQGVYVADSLRSFEGIGTRNACVPFSCYEHRGVYKAKLSLQDALEAHLSVLGVVEGDALRSATGKCTYPAIKKLRDGHKEEQNRTIARAAKDAGCLNAVVLDSVGYCTATRLLKKTGVRHVVVPNNSTDCAEMQFPRPGIVLLPGKTLLQAVQEWDVCLQGPIQCLVADTCRHFNEDLKAAVASAFTKFSDSAVLSITVSTRKESEVERRKTLKAVRRFVKEHAFASGIIASRKYMPDIYRNMLFILFYFKKG